MKLKKLLAGVISLAMMASAATALAASPEEYDGQPYGNLGYESQDADGEFNLAVIANGDAKIYSDAMYIKGSVYSNGKIYVGNGQGNKIDGLFISGTGNTVFGSDNNNNEWTQYRTAEGYIHVNSNGTTDGINYYSTQPEFAGAIDDKETSFDYSYEEFTVPDAGESWGDAEFNVYGNEYQKNLPATIYEDAKYDKVTINGSYGPAITVNTTNGDVNLVIDEITSNSSNINIKVVGDNQANIYIGSLPENIPVLVNYDNTKWPAEKDGSAENTHLYFGGDRTVISASRIAAADIHVNSSYLEVSGDANVTGNIYTGAEQFKLDGGQTEIYGTVFAPNADTDVVGSSTLYGQLYTDTLTINGAGRILWKADSAAAKSDVQPTEVPAATDEPEPTATPAPVPDEEEIDVKGASYAYIFGYEPEISYEYKEGEETGKLVAKVKMAPDDNVTREQVAAMIMRLIDQKYDTKSAKYAITDNIKQHTGTWYARGLAFLSGKGAFDGIASVETGAVTRGEVAKLVVYGLNLSKSTETEFKDIDTNPYKDYIKIMAAYGYMNGVEDDKFEPERTMTRAEFCAMFNNIIGRTDAKLVSSDGVAVTPALYSIIDLDGHWAENTMLRATSVYDDNGTVDIQTRLNNIRNVLDNYDGQKWF